MTSLSVRNNGVIRCAPGDPVRHGEGVLYTFYWPQISSESAAKMAYTDTETMLRLFAWETRSDCNVLAQCPCYCAVHCGYRHLHDLRLDVV